MAFQTFDINALLKLDQDLSADVSKASCTEESMFHNTIKSPDGDIGHGKEEHLKANLYPVAYCCCLCRCFFFYIQKLVLMTYP